jgi:hypothetical protein
MIIKQHYFKYREKYFNFILLFLVVCLLINDLVIFKKFSIYKNSFKFVTYNDEQYYYKNNDTFNVLEDVKSEFFSNIYESNYCKPVPLNLKNGRIQIDDLPEDFNSTSDDFDFNFNNYTQLNGRWLPIKCKARHRVAIIIPYKNRLENLNYFLNHMHPFLQRQELEYQIFVVEQSNDQLFNKGILMNSGFLEIMSLAENKTALSQIEIQNVSLPFDCVIFHDVDLLPEGIFKN